MDRLREKIAKKMDFMEQMFQRDSSKGSEGSGSGQGSGGVRGGGRSSGGGRDSEMIDSWFQQEAVNKTIENDELKKDVRSLQVKFEKSLQLVGKLQEDNEKHEEELRVLRAQVPASASNGRMPSA